MKYGLFLLLAQMYYDGVNMLNVDAEEVNASNWLRWINCARNTAELNVSSHQCYGKILYKTSRDIAPGTELLTFYGPGYATALGINVRQFHNATYGTGLAYFRGSWYSQRLKPS